ncbi:MAG: TlpA family protein disulfide reductase [Bacteroidia bacterium]
MSTRLSFIVAVNLFLLINLAQISLAQEPSYRPNSDLTEGKEIIAIYFGATSCGPCHDPELKKDIQRLKTLLNQHAKSAGYAFSVTGVALDWKVEEGIEFLKEVGPFDEIVVGKNWDNLAAVEYIWADPSSMPAMPQIIVIERDGRMQQDRRTYSENKVIAHHVSPSAISAWVDAGAPLCWTIEEESPVSWTGPDCKFQ